VGFKLDPYIIRNPGPIKKKMIKRKKEIKLPKKVKQDAHFHHIHVSTIVAVLF
jgi:hypothetical protein